MAELAARFERIMFDPLSYIHPQRLRLPQQLDTPRQRAALNDMLLGGFGLASGRTTPSSVAEQQLIMHWQHLPYVCMLVGAQLLKPELAWRGRLLQLSAPVRFFMSLPLHNEVGRAGADRAAERDADMPARRAADAEPHRVQALGLRNMLAWQQAASAALLGRMRLLFAPALDACFERPRKQLQPADLFLISQAIQYAKNHPDHV
jgi:type III secretion system OrgA/MxiK family protein